MSPRTRYLLVRASILALLALAGLAATTVVTLHSVTDTAMLPTLWPGDRLLVRRGGTAPIRGDVLLVATPRGERLGRVIGLPGERVALRRGIPVVDGAARPRYRVADLVLPPAPNLRCPVARTDGECRLRRHRETAADGRAWDVIDGTATRAPVSVPAGALFLLPDDRSAPAIGPVRADAVIGRAATILWSGDGTASWRRFWRWGETLRPSRTMKGVERTPAGG